VPTSWRASRSGARPSRSAASSAEPSTPWALRRRGPWPGSTERHRAGCEPGTRGGLLEDQSATPSAEQPSPPSAGERNDPRPGRLAAQAPTADSATAPREPEAGISLPVPAEPTARRERPGFWRRLVLGGRRREREAEKRGTEVLLGRLDRLERRLAELDDELGGRLDRVDERLRSLGNLEEQLASLAELQERLEDPRALRERLDALARRAGWAVAAGLLAAALAAGALAAALRLVGA